MSSYEETMKKIVTDGEYLKKVCCDVDSQMDPDMIEECISDLMQSCKTLDRNPKIGCAGLAANQLGYPVRILAIKRGKKFKVFINPEILKKSEFFTINTEGCFSQPDKLVNPVKVKRHNRILVRADNTGEVKLRGKESFAFQHEIDHLNGILI